MANTTTEETSFAQENSKDDECRENIPPEIIPPRQSLKQEVNIDDAEGCAATNQDADFENCISSTPAPANNNVKTKSRLSGIQSALTPILKYLNIGNKTSSPETSAQGNNLGRTVIMKTARVLSQRSELGSSCTIQQAGDAEVCWLADECLPDITLLDATCDATMMHTKNDSAFPDSLPSTPLRARPAHASITPKPSPQTCLLKNAQSLLPQAVGCLTKESDFAGNATAKKDCLSGMQEATSEEQESTTPLTICTLSTNPPKMEATLTMSNTSSHDSQHSSWEKLSFSEVCSNDGSHANVEPTEMLTYDGNASSKADFPNSIDAPLCFLDSRFFPEITLLDVTCDTPSSPQSKTPSIKVAPHLPSVESLQSKHPTSEESIDVAQELNTSNLVQNGEVASPVNGIAGNKSNSCGDKSSVKCVGENIPKASLETTRDISMESPLEDSQPSVESSSQSLDRTRTHKVEAVCGNHANLTRDISSKNATFDLEEPAASVNASCEDRPQSLKGDLSSTENRINPKGPESANGTYMIAEQVSDLSANGATPKLRSQNQTFELTSNPREEADPKDEPLSGNNDIRSTPASSNSCPSVEPGAPCASQNVTFERHSLQRSTSSVTVGEAEASAYDPENYTFDAKSSKQNATTTIFETSSSNSLHSSLERTSPPKGCPATGSPKGDMSEHPLATEHIATKSDQASEAKTDQTPEDKSKSNFYFHGDCDVLVHKSMGIEENQASTSCLDETLDLREELSITSTPMVDSKMFNFNTERGQGKIPAQKKLYRDPPNMPNDQPPPNIISDRKTFLKLPAAKSLHHPLKVPSQLVIKKQLSGIPGRPEPLVSGVPMTRLRSQAEASVATASDAIQVAVSFFIFNC